MVIEVLHRWLKVIEELRKKIADLENGQE